MKFQIRDLKTGDIVDRNLSYEDALIWINDRSNKGRYIIQLMLEGD